MQYTIGEFLQKNNDDLPSNVEAFLASSSSDAALAMEAADSPAQLRINVTSPNGTTQAALEVLMDENTGFPPLLKRAVEAAAKRSEELSRG